MQYEAAFYGKDLQTVGRFYYKPQDMPVLYPDILFFCLYATRLLTDKRLNLAAAREIQKRLSLGSGWGKVLRGEKDRAFAMPVGVVAYQGLIQSAFSAGMIVGKSVYFRLGYCGFGFFANKKAFDRCAAASLYVLAAAVYKEYAREPQRLELFWQAVVEIGRLEFGKALHQKNWAKAARKLYREITRDSFPGLD
jgi:hypothetical protein